MSGSKGCDRSSTSRTRQRTRRGVTVLRYSADAGHAPAESHSTVTRRRRRPSRRSSSRRSRPPWMRYSRRRPPFVRYRRSTPRFVSNAASGPPSAGRKRPAMAYRKGADGSSTFSMRPEVVSRPEARAADRLTSPEVKRSTRRLSAGLTRAAPSPSTFPRSSAYSHPNRRSAGRRSTGNSAARFAAAPGSGSGGPTRRPDAHPAAARQAAAARMRPATRPIRFTVTPRPGRGGPPARRRGAGGALRRRPRRPAPFGRGPAARRPAVGGARRRRSRSGSEPAPPRS